MRHSISILIQCLFLSNADSFSFLSLDTTTRTRNLRLSATKTILAPPLQPIEGDVDTTSDIPPLEVIYTTDTETIETWLQDHASPDASSNQLLGFDTESVPRADFLPYGRRPHNEKEGPATLQLATIDSCLIIHLAHCGWEQPQAVPEALQQVLQDSSILKAGVGIDDDALEMYRSSLALEVNGRFDLSCVWKAPLTKNAWDWGLFWAKHPV